MCYIMVRQLSEKALTAYAKRMREAAGKTRAQAARDMKVSQTSIFHAEESPKQGMVKLRIRMIEEYSPYRVIGPIYILKPR
jgi:hypothetical protein